MPKRKKPSKLPLIGDHGTGTKAALAGTTLVKMEGPNNVGRRQRVSQLDRWKAKLSQRQYQAAEDLYNAYSRVEMLSSGGELKEQVDASPKPDAVVATQVDAMSSLVRLTQSIPANMVYVVDHVLRENLPISRLGKNHGMHSANFKIALDFVANKQRY